MPASERTGLSALLEPLQEVCRAHEGGKASYAAALCTRLIESYLEVRLLCVVCVGWFVWLQA